MQVSENNRLLPCRFLPVASDWVRARMPGKPCNGIHAFLNTGYARRRRRPPGQILGFLREA